MKKLLLSLALLLVAVSTVQAQDVYQWFGGEPANSDWMYGMNWKTELCAANPAQNGTFGVVPDINAKVKINNVKWGSIAEPLIDEAVTIGDIFIAEGGAGLSPEALHVGAAGSLLVQGAGGTAAGQINIGYQAGAVGGMSVDGGSVVVNGPVHVGWGGDGTLTITGGLMTALDIDINGSLTTGTGHIIVTGGQLEIAGFVVDKLVGYQDNGQLVGDITYDELRDVTIVTPEPISIALMGLGALLIRRRS